MGSRLLMPSQSSDTDIRQSLWIIPVHFAENIWKSDQIGTRQQFEGSFLATLVEEKNKTKKKGVLRADLPHKASLHSNAPLPARRFTGASINTAAGWRLTKTNV